MNTKITQFKTGREYRTDGTPQILVITYVPFTGHEMDDNACDRVAVKMVDDSRGIECKLIVLRLNCTESKIGRATLDAYDTNREAPYGARIGDCARSKITNEQKKSWGIVPANIVCKIANRSSSGVDFTKSAKSEIYRSFSEGAKFYSTKPAKFFKMMDEASEVYRASKKLLEKEIGKVFSSNK